MDIRLLLTRRLQVKICVLKLIQLNRHGLLRVIRLTKSPIRSSLLNFAVGMTSMFSLLPQIITRVMPSSKEHIEAIENM